MKKAIREWAFNLFTKRITIKVSRLPNDARIEFLVNKLVNELTAQGHDLSGDFDSEYVTLFCHKSNIIVNSSGKVELRFKRLPKL